MTNDKMNEKVLKIYEENNNILPAYAWPGGYPMFYVNNHNDVLCPDCANKTDEFDEELVNYDANWEDPSLYCDHCSKRIESAYAED